VVCTAIECGYDAGVCVAAWWRCALRLRAATTLTCVRQMAVAGGGGGGGAECAAIECLQPRRSRVCGGGAAVCAAIECGHNAHVCVAEWGRLKSL
jgi:hypothetical protein